MRHAPLSGDLRNIRRVDYRKTNGGAWTHLWQVYFVFKGRKPVSQSLSDNQHDGKAGALAMAKRFRNAMENEFAASEIGYGKFGDVLTNPDHGITRYCGRRKTATGVREHWYWQATWPGIEKQAINRRFKYSLFGGSDGARAAAIAARRQGYEDYLSALRNGHVPRMKNASGGEDRAPYTLFMPPDDLDVRVWRYMDFTKFVSMLEHGGIFLPTIAKLGDPFEGSYARGNENLRRLVYRHIQNEYNLSAGEIVQRLRGFVPASCWHSNQQESAAMWKLYAKSNEAVCVQTTFRKLREAFGSKARVGMVRYVDYEAEWIPESNPLAPFLYKRKSFEHEHEVRAIIPPTNIRSHLINSLYPLFWGIVSHGWT